MSNNTNTVVQNLQSARATLIERLLVAKLTAEKVERELEKVETALAMVGEATKAEGPTQGELPLEVPQAA